MPDCAPVAALDGSKAAPLDTYHLPVSKSKPQQYISPLAIVPLNAVLSEGCELLLKNLVIVELLLVDQVASVPPG